MPDGRHISLGLVVESMKMTRRVHVYTTGIRLKRQKRQNGAQSVSVTPAAVAAHA